MSDAARHRIIVALDRPSEAENVALVRALSGRATWFKVGMRQYYAGAERTLAAIAESGAKLFLDLKLHDIPATVAGAAESLRAHQPDLVTVHAAGGSAMIRAAVDGFADDTAVVAVTVLTSLSPEDASAVGWQASIGEVASQLAGLAIAAGASGVVCSAHEASSLRAAHAGAILVTPGVRLPGAGTDDQKRVMTPSAALRAGSSLLVVGRPIHQAADPVAAFDAVVADAALGIQTEAELM